MLCRRYREAQESQAMIQLLLAQLNLRLHPEKTRLVDVYQGKQGFDFLGFHFHKCALWHY